MASAADSGIFGGGPFYKNAAANITEIKNSGFSEAVVWNIFVNSSGDLNFNDEFLLCSGGSYVGASTHSDFAGNMAILKQGTVKRVTFSIGSSDVGVFQNIRDLINSQGTGSGSILYRNFHALKNAIPALDAIDFDDENCFDQSTMTQFAVMLGNLGYKVTLCPYNNSSFWTNVASQVNSQRPGTIDGIHLQCYAGGGGNVPGGVWNFGGVPVYPGLWDKNFSPSGVQSQMSTWQSQYGIAGGWIWIYDDFVGNGLAAQYASAINNAIGIANGTYKIVNRNSGLVADCKHDESTNGTPVQQYTYSGGANQQWTVTSLGNGYYKIIGVASGRALDVIGSGTANGTLIDIWGYSGGANQQWSLTRDQRRLLSRHPSQRHRLRFGCATFWNHQQCPA